MAVISERNINNIESTDKGIRQNASPSSALNEFARAKANPMERWNSFDSGKVAGLNAIAKDLSTPSFKRNNTTESQPLMGNEADAWYQEFEATIGPYLDLTDEEARYYQTMAFRYASQGEDPRVFGERFLTSSALSKTLGLDRNTINANYEDISKYFLGYEEPLSFSSGGKIINSFKTGRLYQDLSKKQDEYRDLFADGFDESSAEVQAKQEEIDQIVNQIEHYGNAVPNNWLVNQLSTATEQLPYMAKGMGGRLIGGLAGAGISLLIPGVTMGVGWTAGSLLGGFLTYQDDFRGQSFYEMKKSGVSTATALKASSVDGLVNAANEALLDSVAGVLSHGLSLGKLKSTVFPSVFKKVAGKGSVGSFASRLGLYIAGQGTGEFIQEASQSLTSYAIQNWAESEDGIAQTKTGRKAVAEAIEEGIAGFTVGVLMGLPGSVLATRADIKTVSNLTDKAKETPSREAFAKNEDNRAAIKSTKLAGDIFSEKDVTNALNSIHDNMAEARLAQMKGRTEAVKGSAETKEGKDIIKNQEKVRRTDSGKIRTQVNLDETYGDTRELSISFGDTIARKRSDKARSYGQIDIEFDNDANTATIKSLHIENGYETAAPEMVRTAIQQYMQDYDIVWEADNDFDSAVKDRLIRNNPDGISRGLRYRADKDFRYDERMAMKADIKSHFKNLSDGEALASAQIVDTLAESYGMTIQDFLDKYAGGSLFAEENGNIFQGKGRNARGAFRPLSAEQIALGMKGVIYANKNADVSTFNHELFHFAASLDVERRQKLTNAINNAISKHKDSLLDYIENHKEIFGNNDSSDIVDILSGISDSDWTAEQEEAITSLYEAYLSDPNKMVSPELKTVLDRIVAFMKRIYKSLKDNSLLNEDIAKAFEEMMGFSRKSEVRYQNPVYDSEVSRLREKYSAMVENPAQWDRKPVKEFFKTYKSEITEMLKEYPKVELDGVLMLEGMREADMPFQKELIQAKILKQIIGSDIILLPRFASNTLRDAFGVSLLKGSFSDGFAALVDGDKYIEFKITSRNKLFSRINESSRSSDIGFIAIDGLSDRLLNSLLSPHAQLNLPDGFSAYLLDMNNSHCYLLEQKNKERQITDLLKVVPERISDYIGLIPTLKEYTHDNSDVKAFELIPYEVYLKASPTDIRYQHSSKESSEYKETEKRYKGTDKWLRAPNAEPTNLTERQWIQVRTPSFKKWFGDWETPVYNFRETFIDVIQELEKSKTIKGNLPYIPSLIPKENKAYISDATKNTRRLYTNAISGDLVSFNRDSIRELFRHDYKNEEHLASIFSVPDFIQKGIPIASFTDNQHRNFKYFVSKFTFCDKDYLVRSVIREEPTGKKYYDHKLSSYKKIKDLISTGNSITSTVSGTSPSIIEDSRLLSLWQGFSKILDDNGEPLVVYHGTDSDFNIFDKTKSRANMDIQGNFFSPYNLEASDYGENVRAFFLNLRNPADESTAFNAFQKYKGQNNAGIKAREYLQSLGYDGVNNSGEEYIAFESNQIKSATDNNGSFDSENPDIYYQTAYHGSPYSFDKFDTEHIGEGDGSQSFGWGLYFSGERDIAVDYAHNLTFSEDAKRNEIVRLESGIEQYKEDISKKNNILEKALTKEFWDENKTYKKILNNEYSSDFEYLETLEGWYLTNDELKQYKQMEPQKAAEKYKQREIDAIKSSISFLLNEIGFLSSKLEEVRNRPIEKRNVYHVSLPDSAIWLDWENPIPQNVMDMISKQAYIEGIHLDIQDYSGEYLYGKLEEYFDSDKDASLFLNRAGITGIVYSIGTIHYSSTKGKNYVIFNADDIRIEDHIRFQSNIPADFDSQLGSISEKDIGKPNETIVFSERIPEVFKYLGFPDFPVEMYRDKLARGLFLEDSEKHGHKKGLDKDIIKQVALHLANPLYVFKSATRKDSIVSVYPVDDRNGNPIIASLTTSFKGSNKVEINLISSIYGKKDNSLQNWIDKGLLLYWNDLEKNKPALTVRLQLPSGVASSNQTVLLKSHLVNKTLFQYDPNNPDTREFSQKALGYDNVESFIEYFYDSDDGWPVMFSEEEAREIYQRSHSLKKRFHNKELKNDAWISLDILSMTKEQRTEYFKKLINTDDGLDDFVSILRAGKRYFEEAGHWDIVSEAYGSGKLSRKRKWFSPVATMEEEGRIYDLASALGERIKASAYNYTYAKELNENTRKNARTNILKNIKMYQELLADVFEFFYQESFLMNELYLATGQDSSIVHDEYLSLSEAWRDAKVASSEISEIENTEGRKLNPEAPINGESNLSQLVNEEVAEEEEEPLDISIFSVDTSEFPIEKLEGSDNAKDKAFIEALDDDSVLANALAQIGKKHSSGEIIRIDQSLLDYSERSANGVLTPSELSKARSAIANAPRHYRDLFSDIFNRADLAVSSEKDMPMIETIEDSVEASQRNLNAFARKRLVSQNLSKEVADSIIDGSEKLEGGKIDKELENVTKELEELKRKKAKVDAQLKDAKAMIKNLTTRLNGKEKLYMDSIMRNADRREADTLLINELRQKIRAEEKKVETRERWLKEYKEEVARKEALKRDLKRVREYKIKLAKSLTRRWNDSVDYRTVMPLLVAINEKLDKKFIRNWLYDPIKNPEGIAGGDTVTYEETKKLYDDIVSGTMTEEDAGITLEELKERVGLRMWNRLTGEKVPLNDWTVKDLEELNKKLNIAWKEGKELQKAKNLAKRLRREGYADEIIDTLKNTKDYQRNDKNALPGSLEVKDKSFRVKFRSFKWQYKRMQELAMILDSGIKGENWHLLVERARESQNTEQEAIEKRMEPVNRTMEEIGKDNVMDFMYGKAFSIKLDSWEQSYNGSTLSYIYLSQFNERAKQAVAFGMLISDGEKGSRNADGTFKLSDELISDDEELVRIGNERYEKILKYSEEILRENGMMPVVDSIKNDLWNKSNGQRLLDFSLDAWNRPIALEEHYLPIKRLDSLGDSEIKETKDVSLVSGNYLDKIRDGFMKEKQNFNPRNQKPLNMDLLSVWSNSVVQQEHLLSAGTLLSDLNKTYERNEDVRNAIEQAYGKSMLDEITDYLHYVADPEYSGDEKEVGKFLSFLRGSTSMGYLSWKLSGILVQMITSPMPFLGETSIGKLMGAYSKMTANPKATWEFVSSKSVMMRKRSANMIIQDMKERASRYESSKLKRGWQNFQNMGMQGLEWVDRYCVAGGWLAKYNDVLDKSIDSGMNTASAESAAIKAADEMVLRTQPTGTKTELARMFRSSSPVLRIILQFQSSMNVVWNNLTENMKQDIRAAKNGNREALNRIIGHSVGYVISGILLGILQDGFDDEDDSKDKALKFASWIPSQLVESMPFVGSSVSSGMELLLTGKYNPFSDRSVLLPATAETISGLSRIGRSLLEEDKEKSINNLIKGTEQFSYGLGLAIGAPVSAIKQGKRAIEQRSLWPILGKY